MTGGTAMVAVDVRRSGGEGTITTMEAWVRAAGAVSVLTAPLTPSANAQCEARAYLTTWAEEAGSEVRSLVATIPEVTWAF